MLVTVFDHDILRMAAAAHAEALGMSEADWSGLRAGPAEDLLMLINLPMESDSGCQIEEIEIEPDGPMAETGSGRVN
jgi:hypothetical protein